MTALVWVRHGDALAMPMMRSGRVGVLHAW